MPPTPQQSIRKRIVRKIVALVVGHLVLFLLVSAVLGGMRLREDVLRQLRDQARSKLALVEQRVASLMERTENFAASSAVTKSLIDDSALQSYLPAAVEEFGLEREVVSVSVINYGGRLVAKSHGYTATPSEIDLRSALSRGREVLVAHESSIFMAVPVIYYGTPQGAVIAEFDLSPTFQNFAEAPDIDRVVFHLGENAVFFSSTPDTEPFTIRQHAGDELSHLHRLDASISLGRAQSYVMGPILSSLRENLFIGLIAIIASILLAMRMGSQLAAPILELAEKVRTGARQCAPTQTNDELETLAIAFDEKTEQILTAKTELEERVARRTKSLAESAEKLRRSNEELDDFAHIASHDLKEPLRGIHNYSTFLLEDYKDKLDEGGVSKLETLQDLTQRMEQLISDLLYFSQVGRVDLALGMVNMNSVVHEVCESLAISIRDAQIDIRIPRTLPTAFCDRVRIAEVVRNLVTNAIKYNNKTERWIEFGWEAHEPTQDGPANHIAFYVKDNGIGIRPKHLDAIFKMFRRLHGREKFGGGHGVGLSIIKKVIERHEGQVWAESAFGVGTTFWFTVPREPPGLAVAPEPDYRQS